MNVLTVFLLCGLWHGASWNFVVWGLWYGIFLALERLGLASILSRAWRPLRHAYALLAVLVGWVFFRAETLGSAWEYLKAMFGFGSGAGIPTPAMPLNSEVILCMFLGALLSAAPQLWSRKAAGLLAYRVTPGAEAAAMPNLSLIDMGLLCLVFLLSCIALAGGTHKAFIYFRF